MDDDREHFSFSQLSPGRANGPTGEPGFASRLFPSFPRLAIVSFARASILGYCQQSKGLFTWARFPRSRLNSKSFVKFLMCACERAGWLLQKHDLCFPSYHTGSIISHTSAENNWANRCVCYSIQPTIKPVRVTEKAFLEP